MLIYKTELKLQNHSYSWNKCDCLLTEGHPRAGRREGKYKETPLPPAGSSLEYVITRPARGRRGHRTERRPGGDGLRPLFQARESAPVTGQHLGKLNWKALAQLLDLQDFLHPSWSDFRLQLSRLTLQVSVAGSQVPATPLGALRLQPPPWMGRPSCSST